ncbi:uncharacterized protein LOC131933361 [Physella acuta]|uniref:uncharacterized protein LOC131933361 n=1 Tax=Physella acuta TaxID=109671 RepID=UPI0027DC2E64|nr:uncharacterized protein LOC131933361 [Physella acuta]
MLTFIVTWVIAHIFLLRFSSGITVRLNYTTSDVLNQQLPDYVNITLVITDNTTAQLCMHRKPYIRLDTPIYTLSTDKDGRPIPSREFVVISEDIGYYQDVQGNAALQIERIDDLWENKTRLSLRGTLTHDGVVYTLSPFARVERDVTSQFEHFDLQEQKTHPLNGFNYMFPTEEDNNIPEDIDFVRQKLIPPFEHPRQKRQSTPDYYIDVVAVVDFGCWKIFLTRAAGVRDNAIRDIQKYFALVFNGVDNLYQGINSTSFRLNVRLNKIILCESSEASPFSNNATTLAENYVDGSTALNILAEFVKSNNDTIFSQYDHVMCFIGYNLTNADRSVDILGRAYTGTTCEKNGKSTSVVVEMGCYTSIRTAARELGHSLSAMRDGKDNMCRGSDRYIMGASSNYNVTPETELNPWKFSNCSISYFNTYINTLLQTKRGQQCLTTLLDKDPQIPDVSGQILGQLYPPSEQCVLLRGNGSYDCRSRKAREYCRGMYCYNPVDKSCHLSYAFEGTTCGSGMLCKRGNCVTDGAAPIVDEDCPFGDELRIRFLKNDNKTCASLIQTHTGYCYGHNYHKYCCATCKSVNRNVPGCEYGDRDKDCTVASCIIKSKLERCCQKCNYTAPTTTTTTTQPASFFNTTTISITKTTSLQTYASNSSLTKTTGSLAVSTSHNLIPAATSTQKPSTTAPTSTAQAASTSKKQATSISTAQAASTSNAQAAATSTAVKQTTNAPTSTIQAAATSTEVTKVARALPTEKNTTTAQRITSNETISCVDTPGSVMDNMSCLDIAEKNIVFCNLATVNTQCCSTCGRAASGVTGKVSHM